MSNGERGYAELHCHTNFSFLDGASHPEELADEAARQGLAALAVTDHDGLYGVVRFAARRPRHRAPDGVRRRAHARRAPHAAERLRRPARRAPRGARAGPGRVRAPGPGRERGAAGGGEGRAPSRPRRPRRRCPCARSPAQLRGECQRHVVRAHRVPQGRGARARSSTTGRRRHERALDRLVAAFGRDRVLVELWDHGDPLDRHRNDALAEVAASASVDVIATNNVHYATPGQRPLATALAAVRARRSLDEIDGWLPAAPFAHLRSARPSSGAGSPAGPAPSSAHSTSRLRARSTSASPRPSFPTTTYRPVTPR